MHIFSIHVQCVSSVLIPRKKKKVTAQVVYDRVCYELSGARAAFLLKMIRPIYR